MAPMKGTSSKNPTVEDEVDAENNGPVSDADRKPVAWTEIFSQHESSLTSHLNVLDMVKVHTTAESEAFRMVSSMLERTRELMEQFKAIQKEFLPHTTAETILVGIYTNDLPRRPSAQSNHARSMNASIASSQGASESLKSQNPSTISTPSFFSKTTPAVSSEQTRRGKKRSRRDEGETEAENVEGATGSAQKRKRTNGAVPGLNEDVKDIIPVSMGTEDISDEVARRLKIREERRKNRNKKPEKRKRESINSNASLGAFEDTARPKKKVKSSGGDAKEEDSQPKPERGKKKKRYSSALDSDDNKAKKVKDGDR